MAYATLHRRQTGWGETPAAVTLLNSRTSHLLSEVGDAASQPDTDEDLPLRGGKCLHTLA